MRLPSILRKVIDKRGGKRLTFTEYILIVGISIIILLKVLSIYRDNHPSRLEQGSHYWDVNRARQANH